MYWTPLRIKELKEKGYKLKFYIYDPKLKDLTFEEIEELKKLQESETDVESEYNEDKESDSENQDK